MPKANPLEKLALSSLIVLSFAAYVLHERLSKAQNDMVPSGRGFRQHDDTNGSSILPRPIRQSPTFPGAVPTSINPHDVISPTRVNSTLYQDGAFIGNVTDALYGNVQIKTTIQAGKIIEVQFLDYPHDRRVSQEINAQAMPSLKQEAIQAQNARVDFVTGATLTSQAFVQSLQSALDKANKQP